MTPEAEAVSVVRTLHASKGRKATAAQEAHAQRDVQRLFETQNLSLPVRIDSVDHEIYTGRQSSITTFHVLPSEWLRYLLTDNVSLLCGDGPVAERFASFWAGYRLAHPRHQVFTARATELDRVVPLYLHGDEGRGQKKSPYLVLSIQSPIGPVARLARPCGCSRYMESRPDLPKFGVVQENLLPQGVKRSCLEMDSNYCGHSYLTRHLLFGMRAWIYKKNPHVLEKLLQIMLADFERLMRQGVNIPGHGVYFAAIVGCKGDMDWHAKCYNLLRCYTKVQSRTLGFLCHSCEASTGVQSEHSFDDFSEAPVWEPTLYRSRPFAEPWPLLARLPFDNEIPEKAIVPDILHIVKLGLARDLIGGIVIVLLRKGFFDFPGSSTNLVDRLQRAHSNFTLFCLVTKEHPSLRGFTKMFFHIQNFMSAPWANSKGSDSMALLRWLNFFLKLNLRTPTVAGFEDLLRTMQQTCRSVIDIFRLVHSHKLFLARDCAAHLYVVIMRTLRGYKKLGKMVLMMNIRAFVLKPKAHALHHVAHSIKKALDGGHPVVVSPEAFACDMCEDFIGRISRLSRRVGVRVMDRRVLERHFLKKNALFRRHFSQRR